MFPSPVFGATLVDIPTQRIQTNTKDTAEQSANSTTDITDCHRLGGSLNACLQRALLHGANELET